MEGVIEWTCKQAHQLNLKAVLSGWLWTTWGSGLAVFMGRVLLEGFSLENAGTIFSETTVCLWSHRQGLLMWGPQVHVGDGVCTRG